jgi:hypothetical protein
MIRRLFPMIRKPGLTIDRLILMILSLVLTSASPV